MKRKIVGVLLVLVLIVVAGSGCASGKTEEIAALEAEIETLEEKRDILEKTIRNLNEQLRELNGQLSEQSEDIAELEKELTEASVQLEEQAALEARIAELEEEVTMLELNLEDLREPAFQAPSSVKVVGTITFNETIDILREFFPKSFRKTSAYTKGPYQLVDVALVKAFLSADRSDTRYRASSYDAGDVIAFQFRARWVEAGLPPWSLGLLKGERTVTVTTPSGESSIQMWAWRNIFLTVENGEYVMYEVVPQTDELIKIEEPILEHHYVMILDYLR